MNDTIFDGAIEKILELSGDQEGLSTYRANRDYNKATRQTEMLRMETDPNSAYNILGRIFSQPTEDFAGVSDFEDLKGAITRYSEKVKGIINEYNSEAKLDSVFKGEAGQELRPFVSAIKTLLNAYVGLIEKWKEELDAAYEKYQAGDAQIKQNVSSDAQAVEQAAQNVSLG